MTFVLSLILSMAVFAVAVAIKGGWLGTIFTNWDRQVLKAETALQTTISNIKAAWSAKDYGHLFTAVFLFPFHGFAKWFLDGSVISLFVVFFYIAGSQPSLEVALLCAAAWCLIWSSMGEEAGSAGDYTQWWGRYKDAGFKRSYGIKKGIQYGCFFGAGMSMAMGSWCIWIAAATFPLCYYAGNSVQRYISKGLIGGWKYSEPLYGLILGIGYECAKQGYLPL